MDTPQELLREKGLRATPHRVAVLRALQEAASPVPAEKLHTAITSIDLVTVYRTLQSLVVSGLAREVRFKDSSVRYEFAGGEHHHHLVCTTCGMIDELPECDFSALEADVLAKSASFASVDEHALEFFGTCTSCAKV